MRGAAVASAALMITGGLVAGAPAAAADTADKIGDHHRALLAEYQELFEGRTADEAAQNASGARTFSAPGPEDLPDEGVEPPVIDFVTLIVATAEGSTAEARQALEGFADITSEHEEIGYLRVNVAFDDVERVEQVDAVTAIDVDELLPLPEVAPIDAQAASAAGQAPATAAQPAPGPDTPDANPYMPSGEIGAVDFREQHSDADGRGVRIGVLDTGVDPTHPALATTTTGDDKLVDWVNATDPTNLIDLLFDPSFVLMSDVSGPTFEHSGTEWTAPEGDWRFGRFTYAVAGSDDDSWGVLFAPEDGTVLVDLNQDRDLTDETPIGDFAGDRDVRYFGEDDPETPINEAHGFVATGMDTLDGMVHIGLDTNGHGTHVAGIAAGHGLFEGAMNGVAPGAEVVSSRACHDLGCSSAALTDGMVDLATEFDVDVINMSIGGTPSLNDGQSARALLYDRLIEETGVQMFISAGNSGAGLSTQGSPSDATDVISVGAAVSGDTWLANYGAEVDYDHGVFGFSSRGPREDGGFKPQITAPGAAVSTLPTFMPGNPVPEAGYDLPPGYGMLNGTSMSSPQAAGGAALLLSKAGQEGVDVPPGDLRAALRTSAEFHPGWDAAEQGHGQMDVPAAWTLLNQGASVDAVDAKAPVCTEQSDLLAEPGFGTGLYIRCLPGEGGIAAGETEEYEISLTRTSGVEGTQVYRLKIEGDDEGTFSAPRHVDLPKGEEVIVTVKASPEAAGVHNAVLKVDNPRTRALEQAVMLTAVTAEEGAVTTEGSLGRAVTEDVFVAVPAGTAAMTVDLSGVADDSRVRWRAFSPLGPLGESTTGQCYTNIDGDPCDPLSRTYTNPVPGIWHLVVETARSSPAAENPYRLEAELTAAP
ncbi:S8 family serine peptidase [Nocardiopsis valliformis]|uniref:S8 family serine peptidase n=1 Tax=Nocardiopsis valliformis TaxID=239974 RepID=UPI000348D9A7|nr:S8 family serine peptidase [Nocardiopsis valliformis]